MSDERPQDEIVSATYRELSGKRSPAHLDQKVLQMATSQAKHVGYARLINWTRPLAWAATIALCLAVTLELTRVPAPDEIVSLPQSPFVPEADLHDTDLPATARPEARQSASSAASLAKKLEFAVEPADAVVYERPRAALMRSKQADDAAAPAATVGFASKETSALRPNEEKMRLRSDTNAGERASSPHCPDEVRADRESWLRCIEALEEVEDFEAADVERESLVAAFPDFKLP